VLGLVALQVGADGAVPVYVGGARPGRARHPVEAAAYGAHRLLLEPALQFLDHLTDHAPGGVFGSLRDDAPERDEGRDQVYVGLHGLEHLGLQEHLS
jgi:hypothetical protein